MTRRVELVLAGLVLVMAPVACGEDSGTVAGSDSVVGRAFLSESVTEDGAPRPLVAGTRIRLSFGTGGGLNASAGCNTLGGDVEITKDQLVVGDLSTTEIGCDPALHDQDTWLAGILSADPAYSLDGDRLTLHSAATTILLVDRRVADPDRPIEDTVWQLDGIIDGDTVSSAPAGVTATLGFVDGRVTVDIEECSQGGTDVEVRSTNLVLAPLTLSDGDCGPDAAMVRDAIAAVLEGTVAYRIEAAALTVTNPNGKGITLRARG